MHVASKFFCRLSKFLSSTKIFCRLRKKFCRLRKKIYRLQDFFVVYNLLHIIRFEGFMKTIRQFYAKPTSPFRRPHKNQAPKICQKRGTSQKVGRRPQISRHLPDHKSQRQRNHPTTSIPNRHPQKTDHPDVGPGQKALDYSAPKVQPADEGRGQRFGKEQPERGRG